MLSFRTTRVLTTTGTKIKAISYTSRPRLVKAISNNRMSSTTASSNTSSKNTPTKEWLVHIPDHPNALSKRLAARPIHLKNLKPDLDSGRIVFGGALLSEQPREGETPQMVGSMMLIKADSEEEVRDWIRNDAYTKGGAWDADGAKIWPFRCAVRTAL